MNHVARRPTSREATPPASPSSRYHYWSEKTERRLKCPRGHEFTPDSRNRRGIDELTCRQCIADGRTTKLIILAIAKHPKYLVAEVTAEDLTHMELEHMSPDREVAYLVSTPVLRAA